MAAMAMATVNGDKKLKTFLKSENLTMLSSTIGLLSVQPFRYFLSSLLLFVNWKTASCNCLTGVSYVKKNIPFL